MMYFNLMNFVSNLKWMGVGMLGVFIVIAAIIGSVVAIVNVAKEPDPTIMDVIEYFEDGKIAECEYNEYYGTLYVKTTDKKEYSIEGINYYYFKEEIYDRFIKGNEENVDKAPATALVPETSTAVPETGTTPAPEHRRI